MPVYKKTNSLLSLPLLLVDEEFETVSTQLLKRTQAMLNKYRLLLLEESRVRLAFMRYYAQWYNGQHGYWSALIYPMHL